MSKKFSAMLENLVWILHYLRTCTCYFAAVLIMWSMFLYQFWCMFQYREA